MGRVLFGSVREFFSLVLIASLAAGVSACDNPAAADDRTPDYRYRLMVEVETPEGLKTDSSLIQVKQHLGRAGGAPAGTQIYRRVHVLAGASAKYSPKEKAAS